MNYHPMTWLTWFAWGFFMSIGWFIGQMLCHRLTSAYASWRYPIITKEPQ